MPKFLEHIADFLLEDDMPLYKKKIILPNKRSGTFLKKYLAQKAQKIILAPEILSIQEFTTLLSPYQSIDWLALLFEFYETYREIYKVKAQDFEEFIHWAPTVLKDFNEIDNFAVNANDVFSYITAVKKIEDWQLKPQNPKMITDYLQFYRSLEQLYNGLKKRLHSKHQAYQGMINRYVSDNIENLSGQFEGQQLIFAGFNALSKTEENILQYLTVNRKAKIFWDADTYYLKPHFEAGKFIKKHQKNFDDFNWVFNDFEKAKNIEIIGVPGKTTQTQVVAEILSKHLNESANNLNETAVVLNEDDLLLPLINSLPDNIPAVNITLGLSLKDLPVLQFFNLVIQFYAEKERYKRFNIDIIISLLNQKYLSEILSTEEIIENQKLLDKLTKFKTTLINEALWFKILEDSNSFLNKLVDTDFNSSQLINLLLEFISFLSLKKLPGIDGLALVHLEKTLLYLKDFFESTKVTQNLRTFQYLFNRLINQERLSFEGEPLEGLQIMGILETRLLDYETVIITSMNENIIPKGKAEPSIIPFELKKHFGLPMHTHQNAVMAYHFYRLLQRAKNIKLIYNNATDALGTGEQSRFITQLEHELDTGTHHISKRNIELDTGLTPKQNEEIAKTNFALSRLKELAIKGFSPTALTTYIKNPVDFYKKKILKLSENQEVSDGIAANIMGNIIHKVMEVLYKDKTGRPLKKTDFEQMLIQYPKLVVQYFIEETFGKETPIDINLISGKNLIIFEIIKRNVHDLLNLDKSLISKGHSLEIVAVEQYLKAPVKIAGQPVFIHGFIDRIDRLDGQLRIIDYKTGEMKAAEVQSPQKTDELSFLLTNEKKAKLFQLLTYAWLYYHNHKHLTTGIPFTAGILSTRHMRQGLITAQIFEQTKIDQDLLQAFEEQLVILMTEIFNPAVPFMEKN